MIACQSYCSNIPLIFCLFKVYGDKDNDGFYRGEIRGRCGLIPCNMVSEIRAEDDETLDQLMKQGYLPLNTPVDRIGISFCICQHEYYGNMLSK